jgi:hypothetical protein
MMARDRQRVRLEDGLKLDLNRLIRQHVVRPGGLRRSTIRWSHRFSDEEVASGRLSADVTRDGRGWLRIELGGLDQRIDLLGTLATTVATNGISFVRKPGGARPCSGSRRGRDPSPVDRLGGGKSLTARNSKRPMIARYRQRKTFDTGSVARTTYPFSTAFGHPSRRACTVKPMSKF